MEFNSSSNQMVVTKYYRPTRQLALSEIYYDSQYSNLEAYGLKTNSLDTSICAKLDYQLKRRKFNQIFVDNELHHKKL